MAGRRRFGRVRKLPSGRWQARYSTPDGHDHPAPGTFATKTAADKWLAAVESDIARGQWVDPRSRQLVLSDYAASWLPARADLKIRTMELYRWLLAQYVLPQLGHLTLDAVTPTVVRAWHASLSQDYPPTPTRQAYALLRAMLNTAVADELLTRNPCTVRGAGVARSTERSVATVAQVQAFADAVPPRYRMCILLAAWSGARWGELVALSHDRLDLDRGTMTIERQYVELEDNSLVLDTPKSAAGVRTVHPAAPARRAAGAPVRLSGPGLVVGLHQRPGPTADPGRLSYDLGEGPGQRRLAGVPLPRPAPHRQHPRGGHRSQHQGADGPDGSRVHAGRADLPARHRRPGPRHRRRATPAGRRRRCRTAGPRGSAAARPRPGTSAGYGHVAGTAREFDLVSVRRSSERVPADRAPGRTVTGLPHESRPPYGLWNRL